MMRMGILEILSQCGIDASEPLDRMNAVRTALGALNMVARVATHHILRNQYGWTLVYEAEGELVTLRTAWKGQASTETVMTRDEARRHYAAQLRAGFIAPDTSW